MPAESDPAARFEQQLTSPWPPAPSPTLEGADLDLWWIAPAVAAGSPRSQRNRALLRQILASYFAPTTALPIVRDDDDRPRLDLPAAPDFNLSDSRGETVLVVAARGRIGVDLERLDRRAPTPGLVPRWFHPDEVAALAQLDAEAGRAAFLRLWTCKEAACKATGSGIAGQLPRWGFDPLATQPLLRALPAEAGTTDDWWFLRLRPAPASTCVIAAQGFTPRLRRLLRVSG